MPGDGGPVGARELAVALGEHAVVQLELLAVLEADLTEEQYRQLRPGETQLFAPRAKPTASVSAKTVAITRCLLARPSIAR